MISPHTPPGTWVVLVDKITTLERARQVIRRDYWHIIGGPKEPNGSPLGTRYQVDHFTPVDFAVCGFMVSMIGYKPMHYSFLESFDIATLPDSLTSLLVGKPVKEDA